MITNDFTTINYGSNERCNDYYDYNLVNTRSVIECGGNCIGEDCLANKNYELLSSERVENVPLSRYIEIDDGFTFENDIYLHNDNTDYSDTLLENITPTLAINQSNKTNKDLTQLCSKECPLRRTEDEKSQEISERRLEKRCKKKVSGRKNEVLWSFLLNLLENPKTCPSIIQWYNYDEGMFKFVQPNKIAELWGKRKNKAMNYANFTRALRYHYITKKLEAVPKLKLVYKFGPSFKNWRTLNPIL